VRAVLHHYFSLQSCSMHGDRREIEENEALRHLVGHVPGNRRSLNLQALRDSDDITIIKTHDVPSNYMSVEDTVFYIVRDGRDATVSLQRHARDFADQEVPLQDIIAGKRNFGFWGNHIVQWHDADFRRIHSFRFEEITPDPEAFADQLSDILGRPRSREPFPNFEIFRQASQSFFRHGKPGTHAQQFREADAALFELYNAPAMCLSGYRPGGLSPAQLKAYAILSVSSSPRDAKERARLNARLARTRATLDSSRTRQSALRERHAALRDHHVKLRRYIGIEALSWIASKVRRLGAPAKGSQHVGSSQNATKAKSLGESNGHLAAYRPSLRQREAPGKQAGLNAAKNLLSSREKCDLFEWQTRFVAKRAA